MRRKPTKPEQIREHFYPLNIPDEVWRTIIAVNNCNLIEVSFPEILDKVFTSLIEESGYEIRSRNNLNGILTLSIDTDDDNASDLQFTLLNTGHPHTYVVASDSDFSDWEQYDSRYIDGSLCIHTVDVQDTQMSVAYLKEKLKEQAYTALLVQAEMKTLRTNVIGFSEEDLQHCKLAALKHILEVA